MILGGNPPAPCGQILDKNRGQNLDKNLVHFLIQFWSRTASEKSLPRAPNVRQIAKYRVELGVGLSSPLRVVLGMDLEMDFGEVLEVGLVMFLEYFCGVDLGLPLD